LLHILLFCHAYKPPHICCLKNLAGLLAAAAITISNMTIHLHRLGSIHIEATNLGADCTGNMPVRRLVHTDTLLVARINRYDHPAYVHTSTTQPQLS